MRQLPYGCRTDKKVVRNAESWCVKQWGLRWSVSGNREGIWCVFWAGSIDRQAYQWWFATEQQRTWFQLRWS
jgi:hypothetical protein